MTPACRFLQPADTRAVVMVLYGSAVPFSSVNDLPGLSLPPTSRSIFIIAAAMGKPLGTDDQIPGAADKSCNLTHRVAN